MKNQWLQKRQSDLPVIKYGLDGRVSNLSELFDGVDYDARYNQMGGTDKIKHIRAFLPQESFAVSSGKYFWGEVNIFLIEDDSYFRVCVQEIAGSSQHGRFAANTNYMMPKDA